MHGCGLDDRTPERRALIEMPKSLAEAGYTVDLHYNEYSIYVFPEKELLGLSPNSTFMCLSAIHIPRIGPHISCSCEYINRSQTHECGNWTEAAEFLFMEYAFRIFGIVSLRCTE